MENLNNSIPYLESDRCTASINKFSFYDAYSMSVNFDMLFQFILPVGMDFSLQFVIMSFCLYFLKLAINTSFLSQRFVSIMPNKKIKVIMFWSIFTVLFIVNMACFFAEIFLMLFSFQIAFFFYLYPLVFMIFEIVVILWFFSEHTILSSHICCISKHRIVRVIYSFAVLNMFWFAHRVGKSFLTSMCFIAISPASTLAVITLCATVIFISIVAISSVAYVCCLSDSRRCAKVCNVFILLLMILFLIIFVSIFSLIFVNLTNHGLSATSIGTIILSLTIPAIMFAVSVLVKKYLKKASIHNDGNNNSINNQLRTMENLPLLGGAKN